MVRRPGALEGIPELDPPDWPISTFFPSQRDWRGKALGAGEMAGVSRGLGTGTRTVIGVELSRRRVWSGRGRRTSRVMPGRSGPWASC